MQEAGVRGGNARGEGADGKRAVRVKTALCGEGGPVEKPTLVYFEPGSS